MTFQGFMERLNLVEARDLRRHVLARIASISHSPRANPLLPLQMHPRVDQQLHSKQLMLPVLMRGGLVEQKWRRGRVEYRKKQWY